VKVEVTKETSLEALYRLAEEEMMGEYEGMGPNHLPQGRREVSSLCPEIL